MTHPLASMTGYARTSGLCAGTSFQCEIKTVNGRGLDIRMRLASNLDALEPKLRRLMSKHLTRGSLNCSINLKHAEAGTSIGVNQQALSVVLREMESLSKKIDAQPPRLDAILALRGVLETQESELSDKDLTALQSEILLSAEACVRELVSAREREGAELGQIILARIDQIEKLTLQAENHPSRTRESFVARVKELVAQLTEANQGLSEDRVHQEAVLLFTKADIREELDRLQTHVKAARKLVEEGGAIGRKLDFLAQEFNREANTLCSKSHHVELTAIGLDLKAEIDQLREQVQNLE